MPIDFVPRSDRLPATATRHLLERMVADVARRRAVSVASVRRQYDLAAARRPVPLPTIVAEVERGIAPAAPGAVGGGAVRAGLVRTFADRETRRWLARRPVHLRHRREFGRSPRATGSTRRGRRAGARVAGRRAGRTDTGSVDGGDGPAARADARAWAPTTRGAGGAS